MDALLYADNFIELISLLRTPRKPGRQPFSYKQLANRLGYSSPQTIAMIHKGQRAPSFNLVRKMIQHFALASHEIELVSLLAEKSIAERKQLSCIELDEKILRLKKFAQEIRILENADLKELIKLQVYLDPSEIEIVKQKLKSIHLDIVEKYSTPSIGKTKYYLYVKLFIDTS